MQEAYLKKYFAFWTSYLILDRRRILSTRNRDCSISIFARGRRHSLKIVCSTAYNDTLGAAYTAYIKPAHWRTFMPSESSRAFKLMQTRGGRPGRPTRIWCQTERQNEVLLSQECLMNTWEDHLARKEKFTVE